MPEGQQLYRASDRNQGTNKPLSAAFTHASTVATQCHLLAEGPLSFDPLPRKAHSLLPRTGLMVLLRLTSFDLPSFLWPSPSERSNCRSSGTLELYTSHWNGSSAPKIIGMVGDDDAQLSAFRGPKNHHTTRSRIHFQSQGSFSIS